MSETKSRLIADFQVGSDELTALIRLYQPVFMVPSLSLYLTFYELGRLHHEVTDSELCRMTQLDMNALTYARHELERFLLIKTFDHEGKLTIVVQKPLTSRSFLNHPMFGRLFALVCGSELYKQLSIEYCVQLPLIEGDDISKPFDASRLSVWDEGFESSIENEKATVFAPHFDVENFFLSISDTLYPLSLRTDNLKQLVGETGSLYQVSYSDMKKFMFQATNFSTLVFDTRRFMYAIETHYGTKKTVDPKAVENPYDLDPISFLKYKQNHDYIVGADRNLIESLSKNFEFVNPVINVLIEYVLETNNLNLSRAYVEKVAASWKRRGVDSVEDALKEIATPVKDSPSLKRTPNKKTQAPVPEYSTDDTIDEDVERLRERLLEQLKKGT